MRVARDGSHAFRRDAEGKKGEKKKEEKTLVGRKGRRRGVEERWNETLFL